MNIPKQQMRRYNLHRQIKKQGFLLNTKKKTIELPEGCETTKSVEKLRNEFNYSIQFVIPG